MIAVEKMERILAGKLKEKRFLHSLGVQKTAIQLARKYGACEVKAGVAGLVHDCAKNLSNEELLNYAERFDIILDDVTKSEVQLLHGKVGARIAQIEFEIEDEEILDAIRYHTTGRNHMTLLDKVIYLADFIEPSRNFNEIDLLRTAALSNIDKATLMAIEMTIAYVIGKRSLLHPDTVYARNFLLQQMRGMGQE
ncbi:MAG: bis(5'-nucleosyl)-tetraphosphatase (symmetrical) YqeK [Bacillota bacterium]